MTATVAVIGGGLGGMTAAGELARAGCRVTLFESGSTLGGKATSIRDDAIVLDRGPTLLTLPEVVRAGFRRLGAEALLPKFVELDQHCTYQFSDGRGFVAHREFERTVESVAALDSHEAHGLLSFYQEAAQIHCAAGEPYLEAPLEGTTDFMVRVARRGMGALLRGVRLGTLAALASKHFRAPQLQQFVGRFATYAGASPYAASAAFALIPHLERAFGVHHVVGGIGALVTALREALERLGVDLRLNSHAVWRTERAGFVAGPRGDARPFDAVVVNADPLASLGREREPLALSGYVLSLAVNQRVPLPHHLVSFASDARLEFAELFAGKVPEDPTLYVCHPAASDPTMAPEGKSGLFVMVNAPPLGDEEDERRWRELGPRLEEHCLERLRAICPQLRSAAVRVLGHRTPVDLLRSGAPGGSIYGFLPHGKLGPFRRPRIRGAVPGLFYSGGGTHPGGGVPLVMLSGHFAAQLAARHLGLTP
jgi:1-hydroxycarotenoid 3,4-desaturase